MSEIMERLQKRAQEKVENTAPKQVFEGVHPKQRKARNIKIKQTVDQATVDDVLGWLDNDPQGHIGAGLVIGKIAMWKLEGQQLSKDHEQILKLIKVLYDQVKVLSSQE
jgi:hypothetical protein